MGHTEFLKDEKMFKLNYNELKNKDIWQEKGIRIPSYNIKEVKANTMKSPKWVHFGSGNIFRAFIASCQDELLDQGHSTTGITAVETFDFELIDKIYKPHDNLALVTILKETGHVENKVVASVMEALKGNEDYDRLKELFQNEGLQIASFTITEKGYGIKDNKGKLLKIVEDDISKGLDSPKHVMSMITSLLYHRYSSGKYPISVVSMDNCSHNGDKLRASVIELAKSLDDKGFMDYLCDTDKVAFPLSMIDKITPRPSKDIANMLNELGFEDTEIVVTDKNTYMAPFVNAEETQYLVIEDLFPNGRPPLEKATGVMFTDRDTVNNVETMKVTTCLNPLHTTLAVFGCLLGHTKIAEEMKDPELSLLVNKMAYEEGLKAVVDPKIIDPMKFVNEVLNKRFSNPYIEDTPQRIATDTSQKMGIRFGETIKSYIKRDDLNFDDLTLIPLVIAGWIKYLGGVDDEGKKFDLSPDPMMEELMELKDDIKVLLSNTSIFGLDLYEAGLADKIEMMYEEMMQGNGSVRRTIKKYL